MCVFFFHISLHIARKKTKNNKQFSVLEVLDNLKKSYPEKPKCSEQFEYEGIEHINAKSPLKLSRRKLNHPGNV